MESQHESLFRIGPTSHPGKRKNKSFVTEESHPRYMPEPPFTARTLPTISGCQCVKIRSDAAIVLRPRDSVHVVCIDYPEAGVGSAPLWGRDSEAVDGVPVPRDWTA